MRLSHLPLRFKLTAKLVSGFCILLLFAVEPVVAQGLCDTCATVPQSPTASPGGSYIGMTGQAISLSGAGSWADEGWITGYYWDFDDGTWGYSRDRTSCVTNQNISARRHWLSTTF